MKYTEELNLKKPGVEDFYDVEDFNQNADVIDSEFKKMKEHLNQIPEDLQNLLNQKIDKEEGKGLSANDYSQAEKEKVATAVPQSRKINGKTLSADITLSAADVGALSASGTAANTAKLSSAIIVATSAPAVQDGKIWLKPV